jgi:hypothetical protein
MNELHHLYLDNSAIATIVRETLLIISKKFHVALNKSSALQLELIDDNLLSTASDLQNLSKKSKYHNLLQTSSKRVKIK